MQLQQFIVSAGAEAYGIFNLPANSSIIGISITSRTAVNTVAVVADQDDMTLPVSSETLLHAAKIQARLVNEHANVFLPHAVRFMHPKLKVYTSAANSYSVIVYYAQQQSKLYNRS